MSGVLSICPRQPEAPTGETARVTTSAYAESRMTRARVQQEDAGIAPSANSGQRDYDATRFSAEESTGRPPVDTTSGNGVLAP